MPELQVVRSELVLGSGRTARAEALAAAWLAGSPRHQAVVVAAGQPWDDEMRSRAARVPRLRVADGPLALVQALGAHGDPAILVVADCLTLWLTALLLPAAGAAGADASPSLACAVASCAGPLVLIGHPDAEAAPAGHDGRGLSDALGAAHREAVAACERVTLVSAGEALVLKGAA